MFASLNPRRLTKAVAGALTATALGLFCTPSADAAGLLVAEGGFGGQLAIQEHEARVVINNGIAVTRVSQVFKNLENRQVEALYSFPVPTNASVSNFSMWINGKEMIGEVIEKEKAREIYNSYKEVRRDPGLLEQVDYKTFELRIFPIAPLAEQRIEVAYYQELDFDNDWATYVYPLATTATETAQNRVEGRFNVTVEVKSEIPIVEIESPSHGDDVAMATMNPNYAEASLEYADGDLASDVVLAYKVSRPNTGVDLITAKTGREDGYFMMTLTPGEELEGNSGGMDYVFVLDISGSMAEAGKLTLSRASVDAFVKQLGADDRFEIVTFNNQPRPLFGELAPVGAENVGSAVEFLNSQRAVGGTALRSALQAATGYADPNGDRTLNLVILSDGMSQDSDQATLLDVSASRPRNSRIFCIGVGNEVNKPMLSQLAEEAGGLAAFVSRGDDFERQAEAFRRKLLRPVATDLVFTFEGIDAYDIVPTKLPNLYHGKPVRVYGRYKGDGPATMTMHAFVEGSELNQQIPFEFPNFDDTNPEIERMWALGKVWDIHESARGAGTNKPSKTQVDEIVRLGEGYSIVTEYTSFLVLENDAEYQRWSIERKNALRIERDRKAQNKLREELDNMRAESVTNLRGERKLARNEEQTDTSISATPKPQRTNNQDVQIHSNTSDGSGGGAIDPISGALCAAAAALLLSQRRKRDE